MTTHNCYCSTPAPDAWLCKTHDRELEQLVTELPAMVGYLNDTIGRQVRFSGGRIGGRPAETPVVFNDTASKVAREVKARLVAVVRSLVEDRGVSPHQLPSDDLLAIAQWLTRHLEAIRLDEGAADYLNTFRGVTRRIAASIDRPAEKLYAGICSIALEAGDCPTELYAERGAPFIRCRGCGYNHDVERRRDVLRAAAEDILMTIAELKTALPEVLGVPINYNTLRQWKRRKRIVAHSLGWNGEELFRVGDILDLAIEQQRGRAS